ncbi:MAG: electron transfer flavoprotein subunit beta/FixA family protein [Pseudomonadota bacterium]
MKILVCVKRVIDYNVRVQINRDGDGVITDGVKMSMNPFDEIAVEEALRLKEAGTASEIIALTIGDAAADQQLRTALAMGADRSVRIDTDSAPAPLTAARAILAIAEKEDAQIVLLGKQAIDDDRNQTGQMLAALWNRPQATFASEVAIADGKATVTREVDAGLETIEVDLPAVITTDLRLNEPRYVKLPDIMKAKRKPLEVVPVADLGLADAPTATVTEFVAPPKREAGKKVDDIAALVDALKERGVV